MAAYSYKITQNEFVFATSKISLAYKLRILFYVVIFNASKWPRTYYYFSEIFIVRAVFLLASFLFNICIFYDFYSSVKNQNIYVRTLNKIIAGCSKMENTKVRISDVVSGKHALAHLISMFFLTAVLLHQDYLRGNVYDFVGFTLLELFFVSSMFKRVSILMVIGRAFQRLNFEFENSRPEQFGCLMEIYIDFLIAAKKFGAICEVPFLFLGSNAFVWLIYNSYKILIMYQNYTRFPSPDPIVSAYLSIFWTILHFFHLYVTISACVSVKKEARSFKSAVTKRFVKLTIADFKTHSGEITRISYKLLNTNVKFSGKNMFEMDFSLLLTVLGTCAVYLTILYGFE